VCVIDSGLARIARHSPWTGLPALQVEPVSRASCAQRAGRAGRTRPGRVVRLYTKHDHDTRRAFEVPEVSRADLAGAALELHGAGLAGLGALRWFEAPPDAAARAAEELLVRLGAIEGSGITALGRRMLRFPVHPRLGRIVCEAEARGVAVEACAIAAALGGRELRLERRAREGARVASPSDLIDDLDALLDARGHGMRADRLRRDGLDPSTAFGVDRAARQLERIARDDRPAPAGDDAVDRALMISILTGFPDRVGKRRAPRSPELVFAGGGGGTLAPSSAVIDAELMVAVDVAETGGRGQASRVQIRRASAIEPSWLLDLYLDRIAERDELVWNAAKERVERVVQMTYDGLPIDEQRDVEGARRAGAPAAELLAKYAAGAIDKLVDRDALAQWRARVALVARLAPTTGLTAPTDDHLAEVIARACEGATSFAELREAGLLALLDASLGEQRALVERLAPTHLALPRRRRVAIHYELDREPWLASRMQDFFGLARAPAVGDGRVPLVLHLLAPNQRPVQVTQDLPGFWVKHYPGLRKQLMRRYPKHAWPEDPTQLIDE
jgi:ATP-dependent helicase HrpB